MKKTLYFLIIMLLIVEACNYKDGKYNFIREFDNGTYLTDRGVAKYISGEQDTAIQVGDIFAVVKESLRYTDNAKDSILYYGHCWGTSENPRVIDTMSTKFGTGEISAISDTLIAGYTFESTMENLMTETEYFVRSYVITQRPGGTTDTAFNPQKYSFKTLDPRDIWEIKKEFAGPYAKGAISFTYDGKLYAGLGENEFQKEKDIYEYQPQTDSWIKATTYPGGRTSNAVAFVILNVKVSNGVYKDYAYIGTGDSDNEGEFTSEFWRLDLDDFVGGWVRFSGLSVYPSGARENAIAFVIGKTAYVGLGRGKSGSVLGDIYKLDPENMVDNANNVYPQGTWTPAADLPGSARVREGAVTFVIGQSAFLCGGENQDGKYFKDLWMYRESSNEIGGNWVQKASFPGTARTEAAGFALDEYGYYGTGWDGDSLRSDFWRYIPYTDKWDERAVYAPGDGDGHEARMEAIGNGLEYAADDFRGYIGLGGGKKDSAVYYKSLWQYRQ